MSGILDSVTIRPKVLVVEDEAIVARDLSARLRRLGYEPVGHARRGEEGIALSRALRPDIVLMDVQLSGEMDGIAAAKTVRSELSIPVVFLTAFAEDDTLRRAMEAQPFGYMLKPFSERDLRTVLEMALYKHQAETRLKESEERYRTLIDWSPDPLAVYRNEKAVYVNPAAVAMLGATKPEDLIGRSILDVIHPDFHRAARERARSLAEGSGRVPRMEMQLVRLDGTPVEVEVQSTSIVYDGAPAVHTAMRDITERKLAEATRGSLEAQLRDSQKIQAIGTLAGGIAHDFNNILTIILAHGELARAETTHPRAIESLDEIRKAATRGRELVRQILSFSRREPTEKRRVELAPIIEESARLLRATLPARLTLKVDCEKAPAVMADSTQIQQILMNLATNAMHAVPEGPGQIAMKLDTVMLDAGLVKAHPSLRGMQEKQPGLMPRVVVSDTGSGMDGATLARAFEPFFTTKRVGEGTGLGLSVVHGIAESHGGTIVAESEPGKGSTFTLYLPAAEAQPASGKPEAGGAAEAASLKGRGQRILYVDDQEPLVFAISRLLERRGYKVSGFSDPEQALEALRLDPLAFDLVVTDYNMPAMSGLDVARRVREIRADLPVALASGFLDAALREKAKQAGVKELIFKANTTSDLSAAVQRLISGESEPDPS